MKSRIKRRRADVDIAGSLDGETDTAGGVSALVLSEGTIEITHVRTTCFQVERRNVSFVEERKRRSEGGGDDDY